jgi:adenine phosphoribosyltransferase
MISLQNHLTVVPDWPRPGVNFLDIQSLLTNPELFQLAVHRMLALVHIEYSAVVAVESRGFVFGAPVALATQLPLIMARKPSKLPGATVSVRYDTEYSQDELCIEAGVDPGAHPLIVDDVLATGGTALAVARLLREKFDCDSVSCLTLFNLAFLPGDKTLQHNNIHLLAVENIDA